MKNIIKHIILVFILSIKTGYSYSQNEEFSIIRISRISYIQKHFGIVKYQLKIDLNSNKVYYRKNINRKFKELQTNLDITLFKDSVKISRIKEISKLISENSEECLYHNEYGYFKIELVKLIRNDEIYGETFLINNPYECGDKNDQVLVKAYYDLIIELVNEEN